MLGGIGNTTFSSRELLRLDEHLEYIGTDDIGLDGVPAERLSCHVGRTVDDAEIERGLDDRHGERAEVGSDAQAASLDVLGFSETTLQGGDSLLEEPILQWSNEFVLARIVQHLNELADKLTIWLRDLAFDGPYTRFIVNDVVVDGPHRRVPGGARAARRRSLGSGVSGARTRHAGQPRVTAEAFVAHGCAPCLLYTVHPQTFPKSE